MIFDLSPELFEQFVAELLHLMGYEIFVASKHKDGGYDIIATKEDTIGLKLKYIVECKRYSKEPTHKLYFSL